MNAHIIVRRILRWLSITFLAAAVIAIVLATTIIVVRTPSHDRDWETGQEKLARIIFDDDVFVIENLRDFTWTGSFEAEVNYTEDTFDLREMDSVDVVISHFSDFEGLAHIFLSFGFMDGRHVSISLETRREKGEKFSPFWGLLDQFETIYVVATDRDLIGLRTGHRNERVYIYQTIATSQQARELFVRLAKNINAIYDEPVMYNTLLHNCTNEITRQVEKMSTLDFPITYKSILPGYFDEVLYEMGIIDASRPFDEVKRGSLVNNALVDEDHQNFAVHVREMIGK